MVSLSNQVINKNNFIEMKFVDSTILKWFATKILVQIKLVKKEKDSQYILLNNNLV